MSEYLSKRMSQGMEQDPGSPEILQELIDVSSYYYTSHLSSDLILWQHLCLIG